MDFRRWLVVGLCFFVFAGCKSAQNYYDYCGPMPDQGGDFMYRKNSVLGGDPAMTRVDDGGRDEQGEPTDETGPEPTPAPPLDQEPLPGMDMEGDRPALSPDTGDEAADETGEERTGELADEGLDANVGGERSEPEGDSDDEVAGSERGDTQGSASTVEWHAPLKNGRSAIRQVRFRGD